MMCLNDGSGTRLNSRTEQSPMNLTLVSDSLASVCSWEVVKGTTVGSNHYPIIIEVGLSLEQSDRGGLQKWSFSNADWETYRKITDQ